MNMALLFEHRIRSLTPNAIAVAEDTDYESIHGNTANSIKQDLAPVITKNGPNTVIRNMIQDVTRKTLLMPQELDGTWHFFI